jgi:hypothetical protein
LKQALLDTMMLLPSIRPELGAALHQIHSVAYDLRMQLEEGQDELQLDASGERHAGRNDDEPL